MLFKGLVNRKEIGRKHSYWPTVDKNKLSLGLTEKLIGYLFDGSPAKLAMTALGSATFDCRKEDLQQLQEIVNKKLQQ
jgi:predicted transcriptional regulator